MKDIQYQALRAQVEAQEFYHYVSRKEDFILQAFQDLDVDGTGEVDEEELLRALRYSPYSSRLFSADMSFDL